MPAEFLAGILLALLVVTVARSRGAVTGFRASRLGRLLFEWSRGKAVIAFLLLSASAIAAWILGADGVRLAGTALPEAMAWISTFEITTLVDVLAGLALVSVAARGTWISIGMRKSGNRTRQRLLRAARLMRQTVGRREQEGPSD